MKLSVRFGVLVLLARVAVASPFAGDATEPSARNATEEITTIEDSIMAYEAAFAKWQQDHGIDKRSYSPYTVFLCDQP